MTGSVSSAQLVFVSVSLTSPAFLTQLNEKGLRGIRPNENTFLHPLRGGGPGGGGGGKTLSSKEKVSFFFGGEKTF